MLARFQDRGPPVDEADLAAFEGRRGLRLPADYRRFLLEQNGGERAGVRFFSLGAAGVPIPGAVLDLGGDASEGEWPELFSDLEARLLWCRSSGYPADLLPIAEAARGLLALQLGGEDAGSVDLDYDPDGYCEWHRERVAGSFADLMRDLGRLARDI